MQKLSGVGKLFSEWRAEPPPRSQKKNISPKKEVSQKKFIESKKKRYFF